MKQLLKLLVVFLLWCVCVSGHDGERRYAAIGNRAVALAEARNGKFSLYRNGHPYYIKGAAITDVRYLSDLKAAGANSVRVYNMALAATVLDSAERLGMTVTLGLDMNYADRDMDYNNPKAVAAQLERLRKAVRRFRNHPALLMWGIGNELNQFLGDRPAYIPDHIRLSRAINDVARMVHEEDPNHPTVMMVSGGSSNLFNSLLCDQVDLIAYNSFEPFAGQLRKSYWKGPYIVSEYGARGYWVSPQTEWYNFLEPTSEQKARFMETQYRSFLADTNKCLGAYAFLWGQKQEYTTTWFSLYTDRGEPTVLTDVLRRLWTGQATGAQPVSISSLLLDGRPDSSNLYIPAGKRCSVHAFLDRSLEQSSSLRWAIQTDNPQYLDASYGVQTTETLVDTTLVLDKPSYRAVCSFSFTAPAHQGPYRLFVYLKEGRGKVVTANACFYVYE